MTKVIVKNKMSRFFMVHCVYLQEVDLVIVWLMPPHSYLHSEP